jgi:hypothetical protein
MVRATTQRRGNTVRAGTGGGSTPMGDYPQRLGRWTISSTQPHGSAIQARSCWPRYAMSAQMGCSRSNASYAAANSHGAISASLRSAGGTRTRQRRPVVSTRRWRVRPWSFFAPSSPWAPLFRWSSPSAQRESPPRVAGGGPWPGARGRGVEHAYAPRCRPAARRERSARPFAHAAARAASGATHSRRAG